MPRGKHSAPTRTRALTNANRRIYIEKKKLNAFCAIVIAEKNMCRLLITKIPGKSVIFDVDCCQQNIKRFVLARNYISFLVTT